MPQLDKVKARVSGWKKQMCVGCGARFSYRIEHTGSGSGATPELAWESAVRNCNSTLRWHVGMHPCPNCGAYQPNMFANRRSVMHLLVGLISCAIVAFPFLLLTVKFDAFDLFLGLERSLNVSLAVLGGWCTTLVALLLVAFHLRIARRNPNRDCQANLLEAARQVEIGALTLDEKAKGVWRTPPAGLLSIAGNRHFALMMMCLAALAPAFVESIRIGSGWHANPGWFPAVVGPEDETFAFFDVPIRTINNKWSGSTVVRAKNAHDQQIESEILASHTKQEFWTRGGDDKEAGKTVTSVWMAIRVPDNESLAHQVITIEMAAQIHFTEPHANGAILTQKKNLYAQRELHLSGRRDGAVYNLLWWNAEYAVVVCLVVGGTWLWWQDDVLRKYGDGPSFVAESES